MLVCSTYDAPCLLVILDIDPFIESIEIVVLAPLLGIFELGEGFLRHELPGAKIATVGV